MITFKELQECVASVLAEMPKAVVIKLYTTANVGIGMYDEKGTLYQVGYLDLSSGEVEYPSWYEGSHLRPDAS